MNNSAEAEKHFKEWSRDPKTVTKSLYEWAEEYHQFAREKELASLTDEVIEGMFKPESTRFGKTLAIGQVQGAKALRDHLKQNNLKK